MGRYGLVRQVGFCIILHQNPRGAALGVVVLGTAHCPQKTDQTDPAKDQGHRDQNNQNVHLTHLIRIAFNSTVNEDADMASAASKGVAKPASAIGMAIRL